MNLSGGMYSEFTLGPVGLSNNSYTVTGLLGMPMGDYVIGAGYTTASGGTSVIDLVMRHEASITKTLGVGIQGKLVSVSGSTTTLFNGTSVYATIGF
jgi:hypothetical protein